MSRPQRSVIYDFNKQVDTVSRRVSTAFHYDKPIGQWDYPRKMERHFLIKPTQPIRMALATFYFFSEFPN